jgi:hypothetical protein
MKPILQTSTHAELTELVTSLDKNLTIINKRITACEPDSNEKQALQDERSKIVEEKLKIAAEFKRRKEARGYLLTMELDGKRAYHAIRDDASEWLVNILQEIEEDAPIILYSIGMSADQLDRLPPKLFEFPF